MRWSQGRGGVDGLSKPQVAAVQDCPSCTVSERASLKAALEKDGGNCRFPMARFPVLRKRLVAKLLEFLPEKGRNSFDAFLKTCLFATLPKDFIIIIIIKVSSCLV